VEMKFHSEETSKREEEGVNKCRSK
jgi:hypothetical protein